MLMFDTLGQLVRTMRAKTGKKQGEVARKLNMTVAYWSAIENEKKPFPPAIFDRVMDILDVPPDYIQHAKELLLNNTTEVRLNLDNSHQGAKEVAMAFARKFSQLGPQQLSQIEVICEQKDLR